MMRSSSEKEDHPQKDDQANKSQPPKLRQEKGGSSEADQQQDYGGCGIGIGIVIHTPVGTFRSRLLWLGPPRIPKIYKASALQEGDNVLRFASLSLYTANAARSEGSWFLPQSAESTQVKVLVASDLDLLEQNPSIRDDAVPVLVLERERHAWFYLDDLRHVIPPNFVRACNCSKVLTIPATERCAA